MTVKYVEKAQREPSKPSSRQVCVIIGDHEKNTDYIKGVSIRAVHMFTRSGRRRTTGSFLKIAKRQLDNNGRASLVLIRKEQIPIRTIFEGTVLEMDSMEVDGAIRGIATTFIPQMPVDKSTNLKPQSKTAIAISGMPNMTPKGFDKKLRPRT